MSSVFLIFLMVSMYLGVAPSIDAVSRRPKRIPLWKNFQYRGSVFNIYNQQRLQLNKKKKTNSGVNINIWICVLTLFHITNERIHIHVLATVEFTTSLLWAVAVAVLALVNAIEGVLKGDTDSTLRWPDRSTTWRAAELRLLPEEEGELTSCLLSEEGRCVLGVITERDERLPRTTSLRLGPPPLLLTGALSLLPLLPLFVSLSRINLLSLFERRSVGDEVLAAILIKQSLEVLFAWGGIHWTHSYLWY